MKVISFCLWGDQPKYMIGALKNAELALKVYPDFMCWFYIHRSSVPEEIVDKLSAMNNVKIIFKDINPIESNRFMSWRFEPHDDPEVELFMSRDVDTRILEREVMAVKEWIDSDKTFNIMRDSPCHYPHILGGMFGSRKIVGNCMIDEVKKYFDTKKSDKTDQDFLVDVIYPLIKDDCVVHDEIKKYEGDVCRNFPIKYDSALNFVGQYVYEDESQDEWYINIMRDYLNTYLPHRISTKSKLSRCLVASNLNDFYLGFYPFISKYWREIVGIETILVLVGDYIPVFLEEYKSSIILFSPVSGINTAFQAQCIRLLYPSLLKDDNNIIISDMDLIPLRKSYYTENTSNTHFVVYRSDCISECNQYPICFCAATVNIWRNVFNIKTEEDIRCKLVEWSKNINNYNISDPDSDGWMIDQVQLYKHVSTYKNAIFLKDKDTGFKRLDRMDLDKKEVGECKKEIREGIYSDFHLPRPFVLYKNYLTNLMDNNIIEIEVEVDKCFIVHYSKLTDRKVMLQKQLTETGLDKKIPTEWLTQFDREILTPEMVTENYLFDSNIHPRILTLPEIANGIAHSFIINEIAEKYSCGLILEDDIIFRPNFVTNLEKCLSLVPKDWEILNLGGNYDDNNLKEFSDPNYDFDISKIEIVKPPSLCTTTCCYLLRSSLAKRIIKHRLFKPFSKPIDDNLVNILPEIDPVIYWVKPFIAHEGSKMDIFCTSLERGF